MRLYRLCPFTEEKQLPAKTKDGFYVLGSPEHGAKKHHKVNRVVTASENELIELVRRGYSVRVDTQTAPSLVRRNLFIDGQPID